MTVLARFVAVVFILFAFSGGAGAVEKWQTYPSPPPMPAADESGLANVNGIRMYYAIYGKGRGSPLLLIHGGMGNGDIWGFEVPELAKTHEVIVADSRGHGRSTRTDQPFTYHLMAEDYVALLDTLKVDKVALVGWSDGGIIGIDIAIHHPERLTKLFAHAANVTPEGLISDPDLTAFANSGDRGERDYKRLSPTPNDYPAFKAAIEKMWATEPHYTAEELKSIKVPTAVVVGEHDEFIRPEHSKYIADSIPDAKLIILKDVSHLVIYQDPDQYMKAIEDFVGR